MSFMNALKSKTIATLETGKYHDNINLQIHKSRNKLLQLSLFSVKMRAL
ncbi:MULTISPECIES: hypothetical protein [unclassified Bartonella]|nr:hypothetical protein [Bartonella sp. CM31XJBT]